MSVYELIFILICVGPFWIFYAHGMSVYSRLNRRPGPENIESIKGTLQDEIEEFREALQKGYTMDTALELFDVIHSSIKLLLAYLSNDLLESFIIWLLIFPIILPVGIKHAMRYMKHSCIRNHNNRANLNHRCRYIDRK